MGVFKRPGSNNWWIRYSYNGKMIAESAKTTSKRIAQKKLDIIKAEIAKGTFQHIKKSEEITLAEYADIFLEWAETNLKPTSWKRYQVSMNQLLPFFGKSKLRNIDHKQIEKYRDTRSKRVSKLTINRDLACLKSLYSHAVKDGYCTENPVKKVRFYKETYKAFFYLTEDEAKRLLDACDETHIRTFVLLGLNTGMRTQEMLRLRWQDINFEDRTILISDSKSGNDDYIPISDYIQEYLMSLERNSEYVISKPDGQRYHDMRKPWNRIVEKANLQKEKCTPHILRHTFATMLVRNGVDLLTVKELARWSDLKLVQRYAHVSKAHRTRVVNSLSDSFRTSTKGDTVDENSK